MAKGSRNLISWLKPAEKALDSMENFSLEEIKETERILKKISDTLTETKRKRKEDLLQKAKEDYKKIKEELEKL